MGEEGIEYSICEVHLDAQRLVTGWTESRAMAPVGGSVEELRADLEHMLSDVIRWGPANFCDLSVGMRLLPANPQSSS